MLLNKNKAKIELSSPGGKRRSSEAKEEHHNRVEWGWLHREVCEVAFLRMDVHFKTSVRIFKPGANVSRK